MKTSRDILTNAGRSAARGVAALFIGLSLFAVAGVWWVDGGTTKMVRQAFALADRACGVVEAGVARTEELIATSRQEVRQAAESITAIGARAEANRPVLRGLSERLETSLAPHIGQLQQALTPVREALGRIGDVVSLLSSWPMMAEQAPRLAALDEVLSRLEGLAADTTQWRATLRALAEARQNEASAETITTLTGLAQRIDARLEVVQASVRGVRGDCAALRLRMDRRQSRLLLAFDASASVATLMLAWVVYSQIIVIRYSRRGVKDVDAA